MRPLTTAALCLFAAACGGAPQPCPSVSPNAASATAEAGSAAGAAASGAAGASGTDPDILALAESARKCEFSSGSFDWDCAAFKEWSRENEDLFEGPLGNPTILALLEDQDIRMRSLGAERGFIAARTFFADESNATRLIAIVAKERDPRLLSRYGKFVAYINGEKMQARELRAYAKHPIMDFRRALAEYLLPTYPTAFSLELTKVLLADADASVQRQAVRALSGSGRTRPTEAICAFLKSQLGRQDPLAEDAIDAGGGSKCAGMAELTVAEVEKRSADAVKFVDAKLDITSTLSSLCWRSTTPEPLKQRIFAVALRVAPATKDSWPRRAWIELFRTCDVGRAKAALAPFLTDADTDVATRAQEETKTVEEELKEKAAQ